MSDYRIVRGERFLPAEVVAACFSVETRWVLAAVEHGVVGRVGVEWVETRVYIATRVLDRIARARALELQAGLELDVIAALLDAEIDA